MEIVLESEFDILRQAVRRDGGLSYVVLAEEVYITRESADKDSSKLEFDRRLVINTGNPFMPFPNNECYFYSSTHYIVVLPEDSRSCSDLEEVITELNRLKSDKRAWLFVARNDAYSSYDCDGETAYVRRGLNDEEAACFLRLCSPLETAFFEP